MGGMFKTADGGETWTSMAPSPPPGAPGGEGEQAPPRRRQPSGLASVSFASASDVWGVNLAGRLVRVTEDGRMEPVQVPARSLTCVDFASPQVGCVAGEYGALFITSDGGQTWTSQAKVNADTLRNIAVVTKDKIMCIGDGGVAIKSDDGGKTWSPLDVDILESFTHIVFADANTGWLLGTAPPQGGPGGGPGGEGGPPGGGEGMPPGGGEGGPFGGRGGGRSADYVVMKTSDGGETWAEQSRGPEFNANAVKVLDAQNICLCAGQGTAFVSKDGGNEWTKKDLQVSWDISDISFPDPNNGWAVGWSGLALRTDDGGENWTRLNTYTAYDANSVYFISNQKGWLAGNYGLILTTENGGDTWNSQRCYSYSNLNKICFADANTGWVVGNSGALFETKDGGKTWKQSDIGINGNFYDVKKGADGAIWITGDWGVVLRSAK